ncbi:MAG: HAD family hydrolase [Chloroflexi bacterium]|nr:MAG: HAD family hydrolase [Chloroflexota bacterium]
MSVRVVGFDGDDTLWHSETRFHFTQGEFRDLLKRHVPDADVDRWLAEMEMKNLGIYGYGVKSFTLSMLETAIELTEGRIPTSDLEVILGWGKGMLMEPTELLDGVEETLRLLGGRYARRAIKPEHFAMVGNSLRSDVVPVVSLGAHAVHIPYEVTWHHEHVPEEELPNEGWQRVSTIRELPAILDEL